MLYEELKQHFQGSLERQVLSRWERQDRERDKETEEFIRKALQTSASEASREEA